LIGSSLLVALRFLTAFISVFLAMPGASAEIHGRVVSISDGDTFTLLTAEKQQVKIRLAEIDAPESGQPYGQKSKQALSDLVFGKYVRSVVTVSVCRSFTATCPISWKCRCRQIRSFST
jgi:endonuclease YncB( thermonuclease family)